MSSQLAYAQGRLNAVLTDKNGELARKLLAMIFYADPEFSIRTLAELAKNEQISSKWRSRIGILLSALILTRGELALAKQQLRTTSLSLEAQHPDQWRAFYSSTGNYLGQLFQRVESLPLAHEGDTIQAAIVGDSHVIGVAASSSKTLEKIYLPTVTFRLLASPQDNALRVAFRNAAALTYRLERVVFSVGEIDSRSFASLIAKDEGYWQRRKDAWRSTVRLAYAFISTLRHPLQTYQVIIPPMPSEKIAKSVMSESEESLSRQQLLVAVAELRDICRQEANLHGLGTIDYDQAILSADGFCKSENLIDHAHFMPEVYGKLAEAIVQS
jgi:hypothetical protein